MATYLVTAKSTFILEQEIEEKSYEEATKIADELDGGDFVDTGCGDWEITHIERVP